MRQYLKDKIALELIDLKSYYNDLYNNWENLNSHENLYKIRIPLLVLATLIRTIGGEKQQIKILKDILPQESTLLLKYKDKEIKEFIYTDSFKNKIEQVLDIEEVCNYLVHDLNSGFSDTRKDYNQKEGFSIYYCVSTGIKPEIMISISEFIDKVESILAN